LAAAGAYALTVAVDVFKSRWLHLFIAVDAAAAGNKVSIIPEVSMDPEGSAASFFVPSVTDGTVTVGNLGVSPLAEYTVHNFGAVTYVPVEILTPAAVGGTDKLRMSVSLNVEKAYWIRFRVAEDGAVGTPATLALTFSKSV
jgi:hypothetical protein